METINTELPRTTLHIFTNFDVVHRDLFERLRRIRNIRAFNVSMNAANRGDYERIMVIGLERPVDNLRRLMGFNRAHGVYPPPLVLSRVAEMTSADASFADGCAGPFSEFSPGADFVAHVKNRTDWLGAVETAHSPVPYGMPCGAWFDLDITCTGKVLHCCMDAHGEYAIGDVTRESVLDIYNSPAFRIYRESLTCRGSVHPCCTCPLLQ